jgi:hypothetical protein
MSAIDEKAQQLPQLYRRRRGRGRGRTRNQVIEKILF